MNKEWSEQNKTMQSQIKKKETFSSGIEALIILRKELMQEMLAFKDTLSREDFCSTPFINADGYHSKTIAYSLFHVFRIEDIVVQSLIRKDPQIFLANDYQGRMNSPIITTGNELVKQEIAEFSSRLNLDELYQYVIAVDQSTEQLLRQLTYQDMKIKMTDQDKVTLRLLGTVSEDERAIWLIDYWCGKDIQGLIRMPLSRHWIMHIEACLRIKSKLGR